MDIKKIDPQPSEPRYQLTLTAREAALIRRALAFGAKARPGTQYNMLNNMPYFVIQNVSAGPELDHCCAESDALCNQLKAIGVKSILELRTASGNSSL